MDNRVADAVLSHTGKAGVQLLQDSRCQEIVRAVE